MGDKRQKKFTILEISCIVTDKSDILIFCSLLRKRKSSILFKEIKVSYLKKHKSNSFIIHIFFLKLLDGKKISKTPSM